jgi:ring-1,2-phenylacetyl-CoA epoxidase subunit PaaE
VIFLEELSALKNRFMGRLQVHHFLAEEMEDIDLFNGMLDRSKCGEILTSLVDLREVAAFFICGPGPMMDAAEEALCDSGIPNDRSTSSASPPTGRRRRSPRSSRKCRARPRG